MVVLQLVLILWGGRVVRLLWLARLHLGHDGVIRVACGLIWPWRALPV